MRAAAGGALLGSMRHVLVDALKDNYLIISDLQIPFHVKDALAFCRAVAREYHVERDNVICVGDETDQYFASAYDKDPNATHTPNSEIEESLDELRRWYAAWPRMRVCNSNHAVRWGRRATRSGIPTRLIRTYRDVIEAPDGWQWSEAWIVPTANPFMVEHGHCGPAGRNGTRQRAVDNGMSTAHGHEHQNANVSLVRLRRQQLWGMNVGCLMDTGSYAAAYGHELRNKPVLSVGVVLDGGKTPVVVPYGQ